MSRRGEIGSAFKIDGGDGDQSFFGQPMTARRVSAPWFTGSLPRGEAYLLQVTSGKFEGEYIAITSRTTASLSGQLARDRWISVVVHRLLHPGEGCCDSLDGADAVGMAAIEAL